MQNQVIQQTTATQQVQQTVTLQQVQLSHLLELPVDALDDEIRKALEDNPSLECDGDEEQEKDTLEDYTATDYLLRDTPSSTYVRRSNDDADDDIESRTADAESDADILFRQIAELDLQETERQVMEYIAGSLNDSGYLEKDDSTLADELAFGLYLNISEEEVHRLVALFQTLEPTGIGAHNLQECLLIQLEERKRELDEKDSEDLNIAQRIIKEAWNDYANRHTDKVEKALNITTQQLRDAELQIRKCNPKPGALITAATRTAAQTIFPDFILTINEYGQTDITLPWQQDPHLKVSQAFLDTVEEYNKLLHPTRQQQESYIFAKDKVDRANAYIDNLRRRRETLLGTMKEIARRQHDFFSNEDDETLLCPMKLQDIAESVGIDISTVSRAANSKYVQTAYGIYPLKFFFNAQTMEKDGQQVSSTQVKIALRELIDNEDTAKPLSDERIVKLLAQQGYKIARRTVAKYRTQLNILPAQMRKS